MNWQWWWNRQTIQPLMRPTVGMSWQLIGRFQSLPAIGVSGARIVEENRRRLAIRFFNAGTGDVQIARHSGPIIAGNGLPIPSLGIHADELGAPGGWYAVGDAGHDLYVAEKLA